MVDELGPIKMLQVTGAALATPMTATEATKSRRTFFIEHLPGFEIPFRRGVTVRLIVAVKIFLLNPRLRDAA
jgi:hypothetical protein